MYYLALGRRVTQVAQSNLTYVYSPQCCSVVILVWGLTWGTIVEISVSSMQQWIFLVTSQQWRNV